MLHSIAVDVRSFFVVSELLLPIDIGDEKCDDQTDITQDADRKAAKDSAESTLRLKSSVLPLDV